jgi:hypothetical protein
LTHNEVDANFNNLNSDKYESGSSPSFAGTTLSSGNLTFSSTAQRITGDMSNATVANRVMFQSSTTNATTFVGLIPNGTGTTSSINCFGVNDPTNASFVRLLQNGTSDSQIRSDITGTGSYVPMTFHTGGSERVRIDTSGNVGIGTGSPISPLTVESTSNVRAVIRNSTENTSYSCSLDFLTGTGSFASTNVVGRVMGIITQADPSALQSALAFVTNSGDSASEKMRITSAGNVGIGTASPVAKLDVISGTARVYISNQSATGFITAVNTTNTAYAPLAINGSELVLKTGDATRATIDSSGNVGIGTASPATSFGKSLHLYNDANTGTVASNTYLAVESANRNAVLELSGSSTATNQVTFSDTLGTSVAAVASSIADSNLFFRTGGITERMRIDSSGNVNIGSTANYGGLLSVNRVQTSSIADLLTLRDASAGTTFNLQTYGDPAFGTANRFNWDGAYLAFRRSGVENLRIDSAGNVGIGTASPGTKLQVNGVITAAGTDATSQLLVANVNGAFVNDSAIALRRDSVNMGLIAADYFQGMRFSVTNGSGAAATERMRIDTSGNVGIGTASPSGRLHVSAGTQTGLSLQVATGGYAWLQGISGYTGNISVGFIDDGGSGGLGINQYNSSGSFVRRALTLETNGNIGIGATPPTNVRLLSRGASATSSDYAFSLQNSTPADLFWIRNDGVIYTGGAANSPYNLTTGDAANLVVGADFLLRRSTSSLRYKSDITDAAHGLAEVLKLRSVNYKTKTDGDRVFGGLIAEEVHDAGLTEFVAYDKEGRPDAIHYGNMVALLVKAVQELTARVAELEAK